MNTVDLSPLYRSSIGFDRFASLINHALASEHSCAAYPPYNIESIADNQYGISLAVAGFSQAELDIQVEKGVLTIRGNKASKDTANYLYQGIANRSFERKFNLADYVEVREAELSNGLLTIHLVKELPEAMKPQTIAINQSSSAIEHKAQQLENNDDQAA